MLRILKRVAIAISLLVLFGGALFIFLIGPWPLYTTKDYSEARAFKRSLAAVDAAAAAIELSPAPEQLRAGWAERDITPKVGHPMAGYGGRGNEKRATGIHERLYVRVLALSDGSDAVVLIGSDMIQTLPNLLDMVEARIEPRIGLTNRNVMYTSSHTHGGPGGLAPGFIAKEAYGEFAPDYLEELADYFSAAIIEAVETMAPARFAHGVVPLPEYIRNRSRPDGPVDATMHIAVAEKIGGDRIYLARYSAHPTAFGEEMMEFNNDYIGAFQRAVENASESPLLFMGGGMGAMRPYPPGPPPLPEPRTHAESLAFENDLESRLVREGKKTLEELLRDQETRIEAMGVTMATRLLEAVEELTFEDRLDIAALASFYTPPPAQARLMSPDWRMSPHLFRILGVPTTGRLQAARIGSMMLIGMPYDLGGETSLKWQQWAAERGTALWPTSFSGAYLGYLSPDEEYYNIGEGYSYNQNYEIVQMGWFGPYQEAYVTDLFEHAFDTLTRNAS